MVKLLKLNNEPFTVPYDWNRYQPVYEAFYSNVLKGDPATKRGKKAVRSLKLDDFRALLVENLVSDETLLQLYELDVCMYVVRP